MLQNKIILIENQYIQFLNIRSKLVSSAYLVFPLEDLSEFKKFINLIRISLNPRYDNNNREKRDRALVLLKNIINEINPDLLIVDHVLVGHHEAETGIDLAIQLNLNTPIMFLSRTKENSVDVLDKLYNIKVPKEWIHKGFSGGKLIEPEYFKAIVLPVIPKLIGESIFKKGIEFIKIIEGKDKLQVNSQTILDKLVSIFNQIRAEEILSGDVLFALQNLSNASTFNDAIISDFINAWSKG